MVVLGFMMRIFLPTFRRFARISEENERAFVFAFTAIAGIVAVGTGLVCVATALDMCEIL